MRPFIENFIQCEKLKEDLHKFRNTIASMKEKLESKDPDITSPILFDNEIKGMESLADDMEMAIKEWELKNE